MSIELNHTIIGATDSHASARFLADILGLAVGADVGHFVPVRLANGVILDYMDRTQVAPQHYAFLVSHDEFGAAFARIREAALTYFADPGFHQPGEINTAGAVSRWSAGAPASGRPALWPRSPSSCGSKALWWPVPSALEHRGGWPWPRWRTGCETRQFSRQRRRWTRPGAPKWTGWCPPARVAENPGRA